MKRSQRRFRGGTLTDAWVYLFRITKARATLYPGADFERDRGFADSPLEGDGFELSVPHQRRDPWLGPPRSAGHVCGAAARIRRPAASASDDAVLTQARDSSGVEVERAAHRNFCDLADNELIKAVEKRTGTTRTKRRQPRRVSGPEPIKIVPRRYRPERRAGTSSRRRSLVTLALPAQPQLAPARRLGSMS